MSYFATRKFRRIRLRNNYHRFLRIPYPLRKLQVRTVNFVYANSFKIIALTFLFFIFLFLFYSRDLPSPDKVQRKEGFSIVLLDRNSKPLYDIYADKNRIPVVFSDIPEDLKKATIAIEDKDFYKHQGFSSKGILRAALYILTFKGLQGG